MGSATDDLIATFELIQRDHAALKAKDPDHELLGMITFTDSGFQPTEEWTARYVEDGALQIHADAAYQQDLAAALESSGFYAENVTLRGIYRAHRILQARDPDHKLVQMITDVRPLEFTMTNAWLDQYNEDPDNADHFHREREYLHDLETAVSALPQED